MVANNICKIILFDVGIVSCRDSNNQQSPTLQGMFSDVINKIEKFGPNDVEWLYVTGGQVRHISREIWIETGRRINKIPQEIEINNEALADLKAN